MSTWAVGEQRISYWSTTNNKDKIVKAMSRRLKASINAKKQREKARMDVECPSLVTEAYRGWDWESRPSRLERGGQVKLMTGGYVFSSREQQALKQGGNKELKNMIKSKDLKLVTEGLVQMLTMLGEVVQDVHLPQQEHANTYLAHRSSIVTERVFIDIRSRY